MNEMNHLLPTWKERKKKKTWERVGGFGGIWFSLLMTLLCKKYPLLSPLQASFPFYFRKKPNSTSNGVLEK